MNSGKKNFLANLFEKLDQEIEDRLKLKDLLEISSHKTVPIHEHSIWYYFGGICLFFFIIMVVSGILLTLQYQVGIQTAYPSMERILNQVNFGQIIRSLHSWGANLMILSLLIHMFSSYFMKAYQKPRELTWLTGVVLLVVTVTLGFTGYLLPWDSIAYFATKVGLGIAEAAPWVPSKITESWFWPGQLAADILRGGPAITDLTLKRFFSLHTIILPWVLAGLIGIHIFLVTLHGNKIPNKIEKEKRYKEIPFFPNFIYEDLFAWTFVLCLLACIAVIAPWGLEAEADLLASAPLGIHPEWYFMAAFEVLKWMPPEFDLGVLDWKINGEFMGIALFGGASALLFLVPFWDSKTEGGKIGRIATYYGIFALITLILITFTGYYCLEENTFCSSLHTFLPKIFKPLN